MRLVRLDLRLALAPPQFDLLAAIIEHLGRQPARHHGKPKRGAAGETARAQQGVYPVTYPLSGADTLKSRPHWFHQPYDSTGDLDTGLAVQAAGDVATNKDGS